MAIQLPNENLPSDIFDDNEQATPVHKNEQHTKDNPTAVHQPTVIDAPSTQDIQKRNEREQKSSSASTLLKILLIVVVVIIVSIAAGASFYFFNSRTVGDTSFQGQQNDGPPVSEVKNPVIEIIDTTTWEEYINDVAGVSFRYPDEFILARYDQVLGEPNASGTPQLTLESEDGTRTLSVWIDTLGISQFINPTAIIAGNPLNAGIHYILETTNATFSIKSTRYFSSRSGVVQSDLETATAYAPQQPGRFQYTFLYRDTKGQEHLEEFMKSFIDTVELRLDADSDGLFADEEEKLGTDPLLADTDGDGFSDKDEVDHGYNPLGEGLLGS